MTRHILQYLGDQRDSKWVVVGKGPGYSVDAIRAMYADGWSLCALNESWAPIQDCFFSLCVFNDWKAAGKFVQHDMSHVLAFATPAIQNRQITPKPFYAWDMLEIFDSMAHIPLNRLYFYDIDFSQYFHNYEKVITSASSSESAVHLLAMAGCRRFHFHAVGGAKGYHPLFGHSNADVSGQKIWLDRFKIIYGLQFSW